VQLLRDPELRVRMGCAGRLRIQRQFRLRTVASRYLDVYKDLLSCSSRAIPHD
jgi:glycosyltransferase involved in cell wall biosynthesis